MRLVRLALGLAILGSAAAAQATTVVIYVEPMTLERYVRVIDTRGPDRVLMCMTPPATTGCTDVTAQAHRSITN
jgi:acetolactate synthase regulatory subunit